MWKAQKYRKCGLVILLTVMPLSFGCKTHSADTGRPIERPRKPEMVLIRGGPFVMGTPLKTTSFDYHPDEKPLQVTVGDFRIGKFPVTAKDFCRFLNSEFAKRQEGIHFYIHEEIRPFRYSTITKSGNVYVSRPGAAHSPANRVTWIGAVNYCLWLSKVTGSQYRLPTEAEWEYAARGKSGRKWPWSNAAPRKRDKVRGFRWNYRPWKDGKEQWTRGPVGSFPAGATPEGVMDMMGYIIGDWCLTKYKVQPTADEVIDTTVDLDDTKTDRIVRGYFHRRVRKDAYTFYWGQSQWTEGRVWTRHHAHPINAPLEAARYGFRVAQDVLAESSEGSARSPRE